MSLVARTELVDGQKALAVPNQSSLPRSLATLLSEMAPFGFTERQDFTLAGTRPACEVLRVHRWRVFRVGHWSSPRAFSVVIGKQPDGTLQTATVPKGVRNLRLEMCADCGAVCVRDVSTHGWAGARPVRLVNTQTGLERDAPTVGTRDLVIGWYSGKRRAGREYR
jgi:hypothetical protein